MSKCISFDSDRNGP